MDNIYLELKARGLVKNSSNDEELVKLFESKQTIYCGFDPSASSMHVGNFLIISLLMRLQKAGHRVIALVGGGTGMIGDPSGKITERKFLSAKDVDDNTNAIKKQLERFVDLSDKNKGLIVNNYDWLSKLSLIDYLREAGRYFQVNYMLAKDIVASRLETGITYSEFSYSILQAYDFKYLHDHYGCAIQTGGSDQWGNLTSGLELIKKSSEGEENAQAFVTPLITRSDGKKFGKSEDGALYLDKELTSPYKMYQYFINVTDEDAIHYLRVFTFLSLEEINHIEIEHLKAPHLRLAQTVLAQEMVRTIHGQNSLDDAIKTTEALFENKVRELSDEQLKDLFKNHQFEIHEKINIVDFLVKIGAASSKREAREFVTGNSISINEEKITDLEFEVNKSVAMRNKYLLVRRGKKNVFFGIYF